MQFKKNRAVVTGIGLITSLGNDSNTIIDKLREGRSGATDITKFDTSLFPVKKAFEIKNPCGDKKHSDLDAFIRYGLFAAAEAVKDAGFKQSLYNPYNCGVVVSSSKGGVSSIHKLYAMPRDGVPEDFFDNYLTSSVSEHIARELEIKGPVKNIISACATGTHSIIEAVRMIESGDVEMCIAGASDASISPLYLAGYYQMGVYSDNGMCPYDKNRSGFIIGEGAGVVILETRKNAEKRGAYIYGEIDACAAGQEVDNILAFDSKADALAHCIGVVIKQLPNKKIDYINTHGTATRIGDVYETEQLKKVFGQDAYDLSLSSTKAAMGHLLGAAGAVEFIICLLSMKYGCVPPTVHYRETDIECDLNYTPNEAEKKNIERAISFSMGFGGHIGVIAVKKG